MMGSSPPSTAQLTDLLALLSLLEAAKDPKMAKANVESILDARDAFDKAKSESEEKFRQANAAMISAAEATRAAAEREDELAEYLSKVDAVKAEIDARRAEAEAAGQGFLLQAKQEKEDAQELFRATKAEGRANVASTAALAKRESDLLDAWAEYNLANQELAAAQVAHQARVAALRAVVGE